MVFVQLYFREIFSVCEAPKLERVISLDQAGIDAIQKDVFTKIPNENS